MDCEIVESDCDGDVPVIVLELPVADVSDGEDVGVGDGAVPKATFCRRWRPTPGFKADTIKGMTKTKTKSTRDDEAADLSMI